MPKIAFLSAFDRTPGFLLKKMSRFTPGGRGKWEDLIGVGNLKEADYVAVCEDLPKGMKPGQIGLDRIIYIKREPDVIRSTPKRFMKCAIRLDMHTAFMLSIWRTGKTYDEMKEMDPPAKKKKLSCIVSNKKRTQGHRKRLQFVKQYSRRFPSSLDVFGRGMRSEVPQRCYKTLVPEDSESKWNGLAPYHYSFGFENCRQKNYFSEKFCDCILTWTLPVYWGCPNISSYFPDDAYFLVDFNEKGIYKKVFDKTRQPLSDVEMSALSEARNLIMDRYGVWPAVIRAIREREGTNEKTS